MKATEFGETMQNNGAPFPSYGWLYVKFLLVTEGRFTLTPSLGVIPCKYPAKCYLSRN